MGLEKILPDELEVKQNEKKAIKEEHKQIDKNSLKSSDLAKRLEIIEKILGLD